MREADINSYEVTFILGESATADQAKAKTKELTELIEKFEGKVEKDEQWGKRDLAYVINKNRTGFYVSMWFTLPSNQVMAFERALRFDESIIRSLVTKAYTTAQPGSLYPVQEEEKPARTRKGATEAVSAEEELRRGGAAKKEKAAPTPVVDDITPEEADELSEEDRLKQLDEAMDELLKETSKDSEDKADK